MSKCARWDARRPEPGCAACFQHNAISLPVRHPDNGEHNNFAGDIGNRLMEINKDEILGQLPAR